MNLWIYPRVDSITKHMKLHIHKINAKAKSKKNVYIKNFESLRFLKRSRNLLNISNMCKLRLIMKLLWIYIQ